MGRDSGLCMVERRTRCSRRSSAAMKFLWISRISVRFRYVLCIDVYKYLNLGGCNIRKKKIENVWAPAPSIIRLLLQSWKPKADNVHR